MSTAQKDQGSLFGAADAPQLRPWQGGLPDPETADIWPAVHSNPSDTEQAAADLVHPRAGTLRALALAAIAASGKRGLTQEEIAAVTRKRHYSIAPRCAELQRLGWVVDSGIRRPTETGSPAIVWTLSERVRTEGLLR